MTRIGLFLAFALLLSFACGAVYEARNSDDVDFFLAHNPEENGAIMFYDPNQEKDTKVSQQVDQVLGVFKNIGEEGRSEEDWVNSLNDKVHLMRVDATNADNARSVNDYRVSATPLLILLDYGDIQLMEIVGSKTFAHVKDFYAAKAEAAKAEAEAAGGVSDEAIKSAQQAADDAKKAAEDAQKALEEAKKQFEEHMKEHEKDNDSANKTDSGDNDQCPTSNGQNQGGNQNQQSQGSNQQQGSNQAQQNQGGNQQNQSGNQQQGGSQQQGGQQANAGVPPGYQIDYIPMLRKLDNSPSQTGTTQTQQTAPTMRYVNHDGHWHLVSN
jgi:hypothetical protein